MDNVHGDLIVVKVRQAEKLLMIVIGNNRIHSEFYFFDDFTLTDPLSWNAGIDIPYCNIIRNIKNR